VSRKEQTRDVQASNRRQSAKTVTAKPQNAAPQPATAGIVQEVLQSPQSLDPDKVLHLQRTIGNRAVGRLMRRPQGGNAPVIQNKLTVGAADDPYEREADRVASQVMQMSATGASAPPPADVSRKPEDDATAQRRTAAQPSTRPAITPLVRRALRQNKNTDQMGSFDAGEDVERQLASNLGGGSPLPARLRSDLEPRFGTDFSNVRVHTGAQADQLNRSMSAQAFTYSNHIYMGAGKYNPGTGAGRHLLAHELTHVVQQTGGAAARGPVQRQADAGVVQRKFSFADLFKGSSKSTKSSKDMGMQVCQLMEDVSCRPKIRIIN
jgi:Domain of unknown function (DUF4157)